VLAKKESDIRAEKGGKVADYMRLKLQISEELGTEFGKKKTPKILAQST